MGRMKWIPVLAVTTLVALAACRHHENPSAGNRVVWDGPEYFYPPDSSPHGVSEFDGWEHCGWEDIRFLGVPAQALPADIAPQRGVQFVRTSPTQRFNPVGEFDADATLPPDAVRTAYSDDTRELWFSPADGNTYAYIVDGESVERWPRFDGGCD